MLKNQNLFMELFECIEARYSVRSYERKDVPNEILAEIITAGTMAPSAGNTQEWEFIIIRERETKLKLSEASLNQEHVKEAPVIITVLANEEKISVRYKERGKQVYSLQDTAACIQNMLLAAHDLGLGACWVGAFDEREVKSILEIPEKCRPVALLTIGFPIPYKKIEKQSRIPFDRVTWEEKYGKKLPWFFDYTAKGRFSWKPLEQQVSELSKKVNELREARKSLEKKEKSFPEKVKKLFRKKVK